MFDNRRMDVNLGTAILNLLKKIDNEYWKEELMSLWVYHSLCIGK
jgi:hypothetical protein